MTVIALRTSEKSKELVEVTEVKLKSIIIEELKRRHCTGVHMWQIAEKTKLCHATISNLICGKTISPRISTIMALAKYLKIKIFVEV